LSAKTTVELRRLKLGAFKGDFIVPTRGRFLAVARHGVHHQDILRDDEFLQWIQSLPKRRKISLPLLESEEIVDWSFRYECSRRVVLDWFQRNAAIEATRKVTAWFHRLDEESNNSTLRAILDDYKSLEKLSSMTVTQYLELHDERLSNWRNMQARRSLCLNEGTIQEDVAIPVKQEAPDNSNVAFKLD